MCGSLHGAALLSSYASILTQAATEGPAHRPLAKQFRLSPNRKIHQSLPLSHHHINSTTCTRCISKNSVGIASFTAPLSWLVTKQIQKLTQRKTRPKPRRSQMGICTWASVWLQSTEHLTPPSTAPLPQAGSCSLSQADSMRSEPDVTPILGPRGQLGRDVETEWRKALAMNGDVLA